MSHILAHPAMVGERKGNPHDGTVAMCQIDPPVAIHGARSGPGSSHIPSPWLKHAETASRATGQYVCTYIRLCIVDAREMSSTQTLDLSHVISFFGGRGSFDLCGSPENRTPGIEEVE